MQITSFTDLGKLLSLWNSFVDILGVVLVRFEDNVAHDCESPESAVGLLSAGG